MPRLTIHDQIVRGLVRLGYQRVPARDTAKRTVFVHHADVFIYVGSRGSVRSGLNMRDSAPLSGLKARALSAGLPEKAL